MNKENGSLTFCHKNPSFLPFQSICSLITFLSHSRYYTLCLWLPFGTFWTLHSVFNYLFVTFWTLRSVFLPFCHILETTLLFLYPFFCHILDTTLCFHTILAHSGHYTLSLITFLSHSGHLRSLLALSAFSLAFLSSSSLLFLPGGSHCASKSRSGLCTEPRDRIPQI